MRTRTHHPATRFFSTPRLALASFALAGLTLLGPCGGEESRPSLLLISFDGFRWDYTEKVDTPAFDALEARGGRVRELMPVFPVETFPAHYTVATGLYPVRHGIISNSMYDPEFDAYFATGADPENQNPRWWGGEPIWVTAMKAGLRASAFFWPGTDVVIDGYRPDPWHRFDPLTTYEERWRAVVEWLTGPPEGRPHLATLYFELFDNTGHFYGPDSEELADAVREADRILGNIVTGLQEGGVLDEVNIVVTGDHGMARVEADQLIVLDDWLDLERVDVVHWTPVLAVNPDPDYAEEALRRLREIPNGLHVYRRSETPESWNYRAHRRITDLVGLAEPGWAVTSRSFLERNLGRVLPGSHGYDPDLRDMHTTLFAAGPGIRRGSRLDTLSNLHVYEMLCGLLEVECAPNDGDAERTRSLLR